MMNGVKTTYTKDIDDLIYLLSCSLLGTTPDIERVNEMDLNYLYQLASFHSLVAMISFSLERAIPLPTQFEQDKKKAMRKLALFDIERKKIFQRMDEEKIWHMSLKGSVLKDDYPKFGMREMVDNDILCDSGRMADVKAIMEELGYHCMEYEKRVDDAYAKSPLYFEMHRNLFEKREIESLYNYYKDIQAKLIPLNDDKLELCFSDEDFYVYMVAHDYKHYGFGGIGLRSLLDLFVFLRKRKDILDWEYISKELGCLGLSEFEQSHRGLAYAAFADKSLTEEEKESLLYYVTSGTHGTKDQSLANRLSKAMSDDDSASSKRHYLKRRIFLSGDDLKNRYPFFYQHKWLVPALHIYRLSKAVFVKPRTVMHEYKKVKGYENTQPTEEHD